MKDTKNAILKTSLVLFNAFGLSKVRLRTIAKEMGISQGNLNYHYKKRQDIIEALYFQLVRNIDNDISTAEKTENALKMLFSISNSIMYNFYDYRFFLLDFVQIMRENGKIKEHYSLLTAQREQQFSKFFNLLVENHIMRKEVLPNEYKNLYKRFHILIDFWISSAETTLYPFTKNSVPIYSELINQAIFPYLTVKGQSMFKSLVSSES